MRICIFSDRYVSVNSNWIHPPLRQRTGKRFLSERILGTEANFFCLIPCPVAKNDGRIPGVRAKFSQTEETAP